MLRLRPLLFTLAVITCRSLSAQTYDVIIRGGQIIDGAGNPWIKADVGIRAGRIVRVGRLDNAQASRVIDATRQVVTPGFIDMHTHSEYALLYDGNAQSKIRQGVTTEVVGEATSPGPIEGPAVEQTKEMLRGVNVELTWNTLDGYFQRHLKTGSSVNVASYVSSCQVRYDVIGYENRPPTGEDLEKMRQLVASTMEQGAFGLTNALQGTCGYAKTEELIELAKVVSRYGGIYATHVRGEGDTVLDSLREAIEIGEKASVPVEIFHLKVAGKNNWGRMPEVVALIDSARGRGVDVNANQYPYIAGNLPMLPLLPPWALEGGVDKTMERLRDPQLRARMKQEIEDGLPGWNDNLVRQSGGWQGVVIGGTQTERNASLAGKTLEELGRVRGKDPANAFFDLLLEEHGQVMSILELEGLRYIARLFLEGIFPGTQSCLRGDTGHQNEEARVRQRLGRECRMKARVAQELFSPALGHDDQRVPLAGLIAHRLDEKAGATNAEAVLPFDSFHLSQRDAVISRVRIGRGAARSEESIVVRRERTE
jgi:N-acyl-D-amino-acid deacylase